jgi:hypothetical protein
MMAIEISDRALLAALNSYVYQNRPGLEQFSGGMLKDMRRAIEAALPHLTVPSADGLDGEYWTKRFDVLTNTVDRIENITSAVLEIQATALEGGTESAEEVDEEAIFERGREVGRAEAIDGVLLTSEPSESDRWRDALTLAARIWSGQTEAITDNDQRREFMETALWFDLNLGIPPGEGDGG